jgi:hypothetical protein
MPLLPFPPSFSIPRIVARVEIEQSVLRPLDLYVLVALGWYFALLEREAELSLPRLSLTVHEGRSERATR